MRISIYTLVQTIPIYQYIFCNLLDNLCVVQSFEIYIGHFNPKINNLWQRPLKKKQGDVWYSSIPQGHNPIEKFMSKLSSSCELSDYYTNHCFRVTGATNLTRSNYTAKQVMSVTGHKSIQSLAIYQKVCEDDKLSMGISLAYSLLHPTEVRGFLSIIEKKKKGIGE